MDVTLVLTHDCNLGCSYCYAGRKFRKPMPTWVRDEALALAFSDAKPGSEITLCYFGGEPTIEWDLLVETARLAHALANTKQVTLRQSVTTNGTLLTSERVATLHELGIHVALSIDGTRESHEIERPMMSGKSSFDEVQRGLRLLIEAGRAFDVIAVTTPNNVQFLGASNAYLFGLGVPRITTNMAYEGAWSEAALEQLKSGLVQSAATVADFYREGRIVSLAVFDAKIRARLGKKKATCPIGEGAVAVAPSGNIYPCERLVGEDDGLQWVIGHVDRGIDAASMQIHRGALPDHHSTNSECGDCAERDRCNAYCACANVAETGNIAVAGGVQCLFERSAMEIADALYEVMASEKNAAFADWFELDWNRQLAPEPRSAAAQIPKQNHRLSVLR
jgi:uncharacterized protein